MLDRIRSEIADIASFIWSLPAPLRYSLIITLAVVLPSIAIAITLLGTSIVVAVTPVGLAIFII